jgi:uncharacterized membrane protein
MNFWRTPKNRNTLTKLALVIAVGLLLGIWLGLTPPGLLGKADALGYAVCHRIPERSFALGERPSPLCARCSGMYLGALLGLLYQMRLGRRAQLPPLKILVVLGIFLGAFGFDGTNSYLHFFPQAPHLYEPNNTLRLLTGTGVGLGIALMVLPVFHQTVWKNFDPRAAIGSWPPFAGLMALAALLLGITLWENPLLLYPLMLAGSASILVVLTLVYTMVWVMLLRRDNQFTTWSDLWPFALAGFGVALLQIAAIDLVRFLLTGTWDGFFIPI